MSEEEEIKKIEKQLKKTIIGFYEPESSRWHRNYTDRAMWYFMWREELEN